MRRILTMTLMAVLTAPAMAWAAEAGAGDFPKAFAFLAAGIGFGLARHGVHGGAIARIQTAMLLGLAFIESLVLFVFVIAVILLFVKS